MVKWIKALSLACGLLLIAILGGVFINYFPVIGRLIIFLSLYTILIKIFFID